MRRRGRKSIMVWFCVFQLSVKPAGQHEESIVLYFFIVYDASFLAPCPRRFPSCFILDRIVDRTTNGPSTSFVVQVSELNRVLANIALGKQKCAHCCDFNPGPFSLLLFAFIVVATTRSGVPRGWRAPSVWVRAWRTCRES